MSNDDSENDERGTISFNSLTGQVYFEATGSGRWANFNSTYEWASDGRSFKLKGIQYSAMKNNRNKGNVYIGLSSEVAETGYVELTNDNAVQDGEWHGLSAQPSVRASGGTVKVWFKYTYDTSIGDPDLYAETTRTYTPPAATPRV